MKKSLVLLLTAVLIILPSCGQKVNNETVTPLRPDCKVSVNYNGTDYSAQVKYSETGIMSVKMLSPLERVTLTEDDSGCTVSYDGMKLNYTAEQAKSFCPFMELYEILKTVCYTVPESAVLNSGQYRLKYQTSEMSCDAVSNKDDGSLVEIETEKMRFVFE